MTSLIIVFSFFCVAWLMVSPIQVSHLKCYIFAYSCEVVQIIHRIGRFTISCVGERVRRLCGGNAHTSKTVICNACNYKKEKSLSPIAGRTWVLSSAIAVLFQPFGETKRGCFGIVSAPLGEPRHAGGVDFHPRWIDRYMMKKKRKRKKKKKKNCLLLSF